MRDEEADEADIGKGVAQVRGEDGLQGSADAPEIGDFKPQRSSRPERDHDDDHGPVAHLHGQHLLPGLFALTADEEHVAEVIRNQRAEDDENDGSFEPRPFRTPNECCERERQRHREEDRDEMLEAEGVKLAGHLREISRHLEQSEAESKDPVVGPPSSGGVPRLRFALLGITRVSESPRDCKGSRR